MNSKKIAVYSVSKVCTFSMLAVLILGSCAKGDRASLPATPAITGDWQLSDLVIVNSIGDRPKQFKEVPHLDDLRLVISPDGRITDGKLATGTWNIAKDRLLIKFSGEEDLAMKVSVADNQLMLLEQEFEEADGSGGTLYYAFAK
ncbi:MAG: hypothetical protein EOO04_35955 [Chitinophagaceae bacterium]|nr:MAG: hypothetical protein EOO04_35955 [Chitinophagaceae bacterium]